MNNNIQDALTDIAIEDVWDNFKNVPTDTNNDYIEEDLYIWVKGTEISEILGWFNKQHSQGIHYLIYERD